MNRPSIRILVIEDEQEIRDFITEQFQKSGHETLGLSSAKDFIETLHKFQPSVIITDQLMPDISGKDVIKMLRQDHTYSVTPIMMLTGLNSDEEKISALEMGADDYVTKPFSIKEVIVRAEVLHRRANMRTVENKILSFKNLAINITAHRASIAGNEIPLTLTEFKILLELVKHPHQVLSRDHLRQTALGNLNVTDRTIDVHMASLRKKIEAVGDVIHTVRGVGYRLDS